jgi:two-component system OmpR family response regulator
MNSSAHLLIVDDDREIRDLLSRFLRRQGFRVDAVRDGREMLQALADWQIDLVILDRMLPGEDGLTLCRELRAKSRVPIIMLTVLGAETDRIVGLEMGADDYLVKPFHPHELLARIKAVLRRVHDVPLSEAPNKGAILRFAGWTLDRTRRRLETPEGIKVALSDGEFDLLVAFSEHPQRVLSREQLLDLSRGRSPVPFDRSVDMQVGRLRRKIEARPDKPELIETVRGRGYIFTPAVEKP